MFYDCVFCFKFALYHLKLSMKDITQLFHSKTILNESTPDYSNHSGYNICKKMIKLSLGVQWKIKDPNIDLVINN